MISIIAAVDKNFLIGGKNDLPWGRIPADMKHFRNMTEGHSVLMGRRTFESIGKPLPKRKNIILAKESDFNPAGCEVVHSLEEALKIASGEKEIFIIGGASVYEQFLPYADQLYLTFIDSVFDGDAYFPLKDFSGWDKAEEKVVNPGEETPYKLTFAKFTRVPL